jgi:hypothetical protein
MVTKSPLDMEGGEVNTKMDLKEMGMRVWLDSSGSV